MSFLNRVFGRKEPYATVTNPSVASVVPTHNYTTPAPVLPLTGYEAILVKVFGKQIYGGYCGSSTGNTIRIEMADEEPETLHQIILSGGFLSNDAEMDSKGIKRDLIMDAFREAVGRNSIFSDDAVSIALGAFNQLKNRFYSPYVGNAAVSFLKKADETKFCFSTEHQKGIADFAKRLEKEAITYCSKEDSAKLAKWAKILYAMSGDAAKPADLLQKRITPTTPLLVPPNLEFWQGFLRRVDAKCQWIAKELRKEGAVKWPEFMAQIAASLPPTPHLPVSDGKWRIEPDSWTEIAQTKFLSNSDPIQVTHGGQICSMSLPQLADELAKARGISDRAWCCAWLPEACMLLGDDNQSDRDFLATMLSAPDGPKPTVKWAKEASSKLQSIGKPQAEARLITWLDYFCHSQSHPKAHLPLVAVTSHALAVEKLEQNFVEWRMLNDHALDVLAQWVALLCFANNGYHDPSLRGFWVWCHYSPNLVLKDERAFDRKYRVEWDERNYLMPTIPNEAALKGAVWMLGLIRTQAAMRKIEATAYAGTAIKISENYRSRTTTNAAIATLGEIGTQEALEALGRLRRAIKDKSVGNAVEKAMATLAAKLGVQTADIAEQSVPDYGFS